MLKHLEYCGSLPAGDLQAATPFDLLSPGPQLVILGTGEPWMERALNSLEAAYPGKGAGIPRFDEVRGITVAKCCKWCVKLEQPHIAS